ncbi:hypothetical protein INT47_004032 [Mucor saturninus]|uniref:MULE transposase domain-containing protein n=1 Tax=Mucor saturninus TaxID=64648 RepID=A0A8H7UM90_9FUNG|nr:hypothetical protein INT47_004032 [Mucor saturninus]
MSINRFEQFPAIGDIFASAEEFLEVCFSAAAYQGFELHTRDSAPVERKGKNPFYHLACVFRDKYRNQVSEGSRKRVKLSKSGTCLFSVRASFNKNINCWVIGSIVNSHNHDMLEGDDRLCLLKNRNLDLNQQGKIEELHLANVKTSSIVASVNSASVSGTYAIAKDVTNARSRIRRALNEGYNQESLNPFIKEMEARNYTLSSQYSNDGRLTHLFFSPEKTIANIVQCPEVLIVNATYRTNVFGYPLINAIGVDNVSNEAGSGLMNFSIALAWVADETKETYTWFFDTLKSKIYNKANVMPEVIITDRAASHIVAQNVKANFLKLFEKSEDFKELEGLFWDLHKCKSYEEVLFAVDNIKKHALVSRKPENINEFVDELWCITRLSHHNIGYYKLFKQRAYWIRQYTDKFPHMGNYTTSPAEAAHSALKGNNRAIVKCTMPKTFVQLDMVLKNQKVKSNMTKCFSKISCDPSVIGNPMCAQILKVISAYAIKKIREQVNLFYGEMKKKNFRPCTGVFESTMKLPCGHTIFDEEYKEIMEGGSGNASNVQVRSDIVVFLSSVDIRWHINKGNAYKQIAPTAATENTDIYADATETEIIIFKLKTALDSIKLKHVKDEKLDLIRNSTSDLVNLQDIEIIQPPPKKTKGSNLSSSQKVAKSGRILSQGEAVDVDVHKEARIKKQQQKKALPKPVLTSRMLEKGASLQGKEVTKPYHHVLQACMPKFMIGHVALVTDVDGDGNCGFRTIAASDGKEDILRTAISVGVKVDDEYERDEDFYMYVRKSLYNHLVNNKARYLSYIFDDSMMEYEEVLKSI